MQVQLAVYQPLIAKHFHALFGVAHRLSGGQHSTRSWKHLVRAA
jgi:hypothetical protein